MDRRLSERIKMGIPIEVRVKEDPASFKRDIFDVKGEILNISDTGACLILDKFFSANTKVQFRIDNSFCYSHIFQKIGIIQTIADIVWVCPPLNKIDRYLYGINFLDFEKKYFSILKEILNIEKKSLLKKGWDIFNSNVSFPSLPLSSNILDNLSPSSLSVDITNLCNLRCKHCFWNSYNVHLPAVTNKNIINSVKQVLDKYSTITNITWYGGEPLINKETISLIEEGIRLKKNNLVITNGTFPIPDWCENVHIAVSISGTQEIHNKITGANVYGKIKENVLSAISKKIPIAILYCVNSINIDCISDFLEEWVNKRTIGIVFTVYVPIKNRPSHLSLSDIQRDKVVSLLLRMKKQYGRLICNSEAMIELISAKYGEELAKNCPMNVFNKSGKVYSLHICNDGSIRVPCALGKDAFHLHCRSVTKVALYAGGVLHDKESFLALLRMYHSKSHCRR